MNSVVGQDRLAQGAAAVLPWRQAARLLPFGKRGFGWLEERGLVLDRLGCRVVIWGDVLAALQDEPPAAEHRKRRGPPPPRVSLSA